MRFLKEACLLNRRSHLVGDSDQHLFFFVVVRVRAIGLNADDPDDLRADFHRDTEPGARHLHRAPRDRIQGVVLFFLPVANVQGFLSQHHVRTQPCAQRSADGLFADTLINADAKIQFLGGGIVQRDAQHVAGERRRDLQIDHLQQFVEPRRLGHRARDPVQHREVVNAPPRFRRQAYAFDRERDVVREQG